jgi:hypothetical protein
MKKDTDRSLQVERDTYYHHGVVLVLIQALTGSSFASAIDGMRCVQQLLTTIVTIQKMRHAMRVGDTEC